MISSTAQPLDPRAIGRRSSTHEHSYTRRDVAWYALSVGAGTAELPYFYDRAGHEVLPSYAVVATLSACREVLVAFAGRVDGAIHRYQRVSFERPLPPEGTLFTVAELVSVASVGGLVEARGRSETRDTQGLLLFTTEFAIVYRGATVESVGDRPLRAKRPVPDRPADLRVVERTFPTQALFYAQNGDDNPIHVLHAAAKQAGFAAPVLHGLCVFGILCRVVVANTPPGKRLQSLETVFRAPAYPGDSLSLEGWYEGDDLLLRAATVERPSDLVLQHVRASYVGRASPF
jgi:acyl dehydratase